MDKQIVQTIRRLARSATTRTASKPATVFALSVIIVWCLFGRRVNNVEEICRERGSSDKTPINVRLGK